MKAVILVGGNGTRLRPITYEIPKPLVPVKKKPIVNHLIEFFARHGVDEVGLLASQSHHPDFMRWMKAWDGELPITKINIFLEEKPRGTFGGVMTLRDWIGNENFILSNGDELKDFDLTQLIEFQAKSDGVGTIAIVPVKKPHEYGVPVMNGSHILEFLEKPENPPSNFVSSGLYVLSPRIFEYADPAQEFIMIEKDIFPRAAKDKKLSGVKFEHARWYDCGNLERWECAMNEW